VPNEKEAWNRRKEAARKYQPKRVRLLLVAESPPPDLERYFYFEDGKSVDELFEEVCFVLFEGQPGDDKVPYLKELRRRGVFLVDAKPDAPRKGEPLGPFVGPLLLNLDAYAPEHVVLLTADVYAAAYAPMKEAGLPVVDVRVPFSATEERVDFRQKLRQALVRAGLEKLIRPLPAGKKGAEAS
jgi:hypothetical protein